MLPADHAAWLQPLLQLVAPLANAGTPAVVMPTDLIVGIGGAAIGAAGGAFAGWLAYRAKSREDTQQLIDQLQEERQMFVNQLSAERAQMAADRKSYEERVDRFWADKAASRNYVGSLLDHIWLRKEPPPPEPPPGYIP